MELLIDYSTFLLSKLFNLANFVYISENLINGKKYIGSHNGNKKEYYGSGILISKAIKKYGKHNFRRTILKEYKNIEEARASEEEFIKKYNTLDPNGYNISPTGGLTIYGCHSEITRRKIGEALKGKKRNEDQKRRMSYSAKSRKINGNQKYFSELQKFTIIRLHLMLKFPVNRIAETMGINKDRIKRFLLKYNFYRPFGLYSRKKAIIRY